MSQLQDYLCKKILTFHKKVVKKNEKSIKSFFKYLICAFLIECGIVYTCYTAYLFIFSGIIIFFPICFLAIPLLIFFLSIKEGWKRIGGCLFLVNLFFLIYVFFLRYL